jgi:hypothetical protein
VPRIRIRIRGVCFRPNTKDRIKDRILKFDLNAIDVEGRLLYVENITLKDLLRSRCYKRRRGTFGLDRID